MAATLEHDGGNIYRILISGRLDGPDLERLERRAAAEIRRAGPIRLLITLDAFTGWEKSANWQNLGFFVRYGDDIERIAIVGDERWRAEVLMFAGAGLRKAPVEFFSAPEAQRAAEWIGR